LRVAAQIPAQGSLCSKLPGMGKLLGSVKSCEDHQKYVTCGWPLPTKKHVEMAKRLLLSGKLNER